MFTNKENSSVRLVSFLRITAVLLIIGLVFAPQTSLLAAPLTQDSGPTIIDPEGQNPVKPQAPEGNGSFLLLLEAPKQLIPEELPARLDSPQAQKYVSELLEKSAHGLISELKQMESDGEIGGFELAPDQFGVRVHSVDGSDGSQIARRIQDKSVTMVVPSGQPVPECASQVSKDLAKRAQIISYEVPALIDGVKPDLDSYSSDSDGKIEIYMYDNATFTYVRGKVAANSTVTMQLRRSGSVIATEVTMSDSDGYYYIFPTYYSSCGSSDSDAYSWTVRAGDEVWVTVGSTTYKTTAARLLAWLDPIANTAGGSTSPGRKVDVSLDYTTGNPCSFSTQSRSTTADGAGNFLVTGFVDFNRMSYGVAHSRDANGNSTFVYLEAFRITTYAGPTNWVSGVLKPLISISINLVRGGSTIETVNATTGSDGWFSINFSNTIQGNDIIQASGGGVSVSFTQATLTTNINPTTNQVTGTTLPNRLVHGYISHPKVQFKATCNVYSSSCGYSYADGSGKYTIPFNDIIKGDYVETYVYDGEGNYQYGGWAGSLALALDRTYNYVEGTWSSDYKTLTISIWRSGSEIFTTTTSTNLDSVFSRYVGSLQTKDTVRVTDGVTTIEMVVPDMTGRLNGGTNLATGSGPAGHIVGYFYHYNPTSGYGAYYCNEGNSGGSYNLAYSGITFSGWARGDLIVRDANDNFTYVSPRAFTVGLYKEDSYLYGYTETPNVQVNITHKRGGSTLGTYSASAGSSGYFYNSLSGTNKFQQGDQVIVDPLDSTSATLSVPQLTVNRDVQGNRVYGKSPANSYVFTSLLRYFGAYNDSYYSWGISGMSNSNGDYSISYEGGTWWLDCSAVKVGHACAYVRAYYYNNQGHGFYLYPSNYPTLVSADNFESDDTAATAKNYITTQAHTLHTSSDVDWIRVVLSHDPSDELQEHLFAFSNLGWNMGVRMTLYDTDGTTLLLGPYEFWQGGRTSKVIYLLGNSDYPLLAKIEPIDSYSHSGCDSNYSFTFMPVRGQTFLPYITR